MTNLAVKVSVTDTNEVVELLEVLAENYDQLPSSVKLSLESLTNGETLSWNSDWLAKHGYDGTKVNVFADGVKINSVKCLYPFRKVIAFYDENTLVREIKAEHAQIKLEDGYVIREW